MTEFRYKITEAAIQLGAKPPYNCISIPVRMNDGQPEVKIGETWHHYPKDERRTLLTKFHGQPVAGITTTWELDR